MNRLLVVAIGLIAFLFACEEPNEACPCDDELERVELLKNELNRFNQEIRSGNETFIQISLMMDSIDMLRDVIRINQLRDEINQQDLLDRIEEAKDYIADAKDRIDELEEELRRSSSSRTAGYQVVIQTLRVTIQEKEDSLKMQSKRIRNLEIENTELAMDLQDTEEELFTSKQEHQETQLEVYQLNRVLEEKEKELKNQERAIYQSKKKLADIYYQLGEAFEELADKTRRLKVREKEGFLEEALEYFRLSSETGNHAALRKVRELEKRLR